MERPRKPHARFSQCIGLCGALCCAFSAVAGLVPAGGAEPPAGYVHALFDGHDLSHFVVSNCEASVEGESLVLLSGDGWLRSTQEYGDFVLELDWLARKEADYDSGVYFRAALPKPGATFPARYQVNLLQGQEGNVKTLPGATSTGLVKPGEWNHFRLTVIGNSAALEINGQPAWSVEGVEPLTGYVGLQSEVNKGGQFEFRNITITELGYAPLFNEQDLAGWEGAEQDAALCWQVTDGLLQCTGSPGPWLRTVEQYEDFNLRLEYKLEPGGNSGIYVRVPLGGAHQGRENAGGGPSGTEVQILDDVSERYAGIQPYQFAGSVYAIAPAREHVARPAGEWNTLEIDCHGTDYRVVHNGVEIVNAQLAEFPELGNRELRGYLGLQNHSEPVWFRHLRLGPSQAGLK